MALTELKKLEDETGMFGSIDEQWIKKNENKTFAELQQMGDPMAGLMGGFGGGKEDPKKDLIAQENEGNIDQPKKEEDDGNK
jgi:hypothetical protein